MNDLDKRYYKIGEVSELLGLPLSTLRFWESQFTILSPKRNDKGTRFYTPKDIETLRMIHFLIKEKGLKIDAAREQIANNRTGVSRQAQSIVRLKKIRAELQQMLDALNSLR
ncbi:MAG: MerR family transcriptional regulator [Pseudoflavonifractor sp.]|nr:MerR family transcriptional regulator [Pseudoflavonifractor sp.]